MSVRQDGFFSFLGMRKKVLAVRLVCQQRLTDIYQLMQAVLSLNQESVRRVNTFVGDLSLAERPSDMITPSVTECSHLETGAATVYYKLKLT